MTFAADGPRQKKKNKIAEVKAKDITPMMRLS